MKSESSLDPVPSWVPASGHALRHAGIHFDAVRIAGVYGERAAYELLQATDFAAGPVIHEATGMRNMYFLLPPQTVFEHTWPSGARALSRNSKGEAFVGVPALYGFTWPLNWRSRPSLEAQFVDARMLNDVVRGILGDVR